MPTKKSLGADDLPDPNRKPDYQIMREQHFDTGDIWHIKLGKSQIVRSDFSPAHESIRFAECEYVNVVSSRWEGKDDNGKFFYEESTVTAANEHGDDEKARLYFVNKRLDLWQIMFAIGEI